MLGLLTGTAQDIDAAGGTPRRALGWCAHHARWPLTVARSVPTSRVKPPPRAPLSGGVSHVHVRLHRGERLVRGPQVVLEVRLVGAPPGRVVNELAKTSLPGGGRPQAKVSMNGMRRVDAQAQGDPSPQQSRAEGA